jgi:predicted RNase H-like HicB family nuclease
VFKILDDNNSGSLDIQEFWKAMCDFRLKFSEDEVRRLFELFDADGSGEIDIDEFFQAVKGPMSPFRKELVKKVFAKLDLDGSGQIDQKEIFDLYNAKSHPEVLAKRKTEEEVLQEFMETFEVHKQTVKEEGLSKKGDGKVSLAEFMDYYSNVSASIDNDEYFQLMMTNAWNLGNKSYKKGLLMEL